MKRILLTVALVSSAFLMQAQLAIKVSPFTFPRNMYFTGHVEYLIPNTPRVSAAIGVSPNISYSLLEDTDNDGLYYYSKDEAISHPGFSIDPEVRVYQRKNMEGAYAGLYSSFRSSWGTNNEYADRIEDPADTTGNTFLYLNPTGGTQKFNTLITVVGVQVGYQKFLGPGDRILFDFYAGFGKKIASWNYSSDQNLLGSGLESNVSPGTGIESIALRANLSIGILLFKGDE